VTCPDPILLSQLLDGELSSMEAASIQPHLDTCATCQDRLKRLRTVTDAGRLAMAAAEDGPGETPGRDCLAPDRLAGWAAGQLPPEELRSAELHLAACGSCLDQALDAVRLMRTLDAGPALEVPATLRARVASRWSAPPSEEESLTAVVIRIARAGLTLVERHLVAPVLEVEETAPAPSAVRAGERTDAVSFRILAPEAKIHATVVTEGDAVGLSLTLLGNGDDALGGQRVFLRRHGRSIYSARTDAAGALEMPRLEPGVYEVACPGIGTSFRLDLRR
jgi:Putative zinc-finger